MDSERQLSWLNIGVLAVVLLAIGIGAAALLRMDPAAERGNLLPEVFDYDLAKYEKTDPALIHYRETARIECGMREVRAITVGPEDRIFLAGDKAIKVFSPDGATVKQIPLEQEPQCLGIGMAGHKFPGRIYVGMRDHVEVFNANGTRESVWSRPAQRSVLTSIAVADEDVFVADAGVPIVWHYDTAGKLLGRIGGRDEAAGIPQLIVPSPYFDVAIAPDGLLRVANPGMQHIQAFTFDGHLETSWGKRGMSIDAFCGCCNPSNIAIFPDGRIVTAEKGLPRVKVYSESGEFESVVVGPETLAPNLVATVETRDELRLHPADVAVDGRSRILVLDPAARCIRVYEHK